jgi:hypothetical protein
MAVDITFDGSWARLTFSGELTSSDLLDAIGAVLELESRVTPAPHRLVDLGPSTTVAIGFGDVAQLTALRRSIPPPNPIRTALVCHTPAQQGFARMFQTLNDHPLVTVAVFPDHARAEAWLREGRARSG